MHSHAPADPAASPSLVAIPTGLLKDVSRSFYLTLRVLPRAIRSQIGLAYLLARATDTIADTEMVPLAQRLEVLRALRGRFMATTRTRLELGPLIEAVTARAASPPSYGSMAERTLLGRIEELLGALERFAPADQELVREVLSIITSGQELDLQRFAEAGRAHLVALQSDEELDDYTWRVAGCVGRFWTQLCQAHLFPATPLAETGLIENGVRFGKGLQLVNILRDLPVDLRQGRCYLPAPALVAHGLEPANLLDPTLAPRFRPCYDRYLDLAQAHLGAGWDYTNALPHQCLRVRLACAWPILIGLKTLARLRTANMLDPERRVKISRAEVRGLILRSVLAWPRPRAWQRLFQAACSASARRHTPQGRG